nr:glycosyltransferase family 2 protein [Geothrix fuzhouensis]
MNLPDKTDGLVGIVVLNYRGATKTLACLESLAKLDYQNHRIVVVDNASLDGSAEQIAQGSPGVELIQSDQNLGYAGGNALGVRRCLEWGAVYVWVLNNDTQVMPTTLSAMVREAQLHPKTGAVGCVIRDEQDPSRVLAMGGGRLFPLIARAWHVTKLEDVNKLDFLTGASILIPTPVIQAIGFISEDYFLYWEDVDYCYRLREHGYELHVALDASILHDESSSIGRASQLRYYYSTRSMVKFLYTHYRQSWVLSAGFWYCWRVIKPIFEFDFKLCHLFAKALFDGAKNRRNKLYAQK